MLSLSSPFRWHIWSSLWGFISKFIRSIYLPRYRGATATPTLNDDAELGRTKAQFQHNAKSPEESNYVVADRPTVEQSGNEIILHVKQPPKCISIGFSGIICEIDEDTIVKHPKVIPNNDPYNQMYRDMIINERLVYERLGSHKGIISYLGVHDEVTGAIRLAYAKEGDLECYIQSHDKPSETIRTTWIQLLVETFWYIYSQKVLHQDVKPNNILVENGTLKVVDFANATMHALDADMEEVCAKDPLSRVDILSLGCIIYSIAAWRVFYYDYFEHDCWPEPENLPATSGLVYDDIINKCWTDSYGTIKSLYEDCNAFSGMKW
ncbi:serine/threonine protein kinase [Blastomyces gilchristii SLH14081]|uniref:Serine/threonine-protein kinase ATG1 n=1 Tax=Blastomyces gilchristii (strain SLH14081) TaxID=559298 RepID=A0A179V1Z9_BLAGS|nr:serine/threonine protein kinase [Blastomyces gilchristii SLH14081]OAT13479.1 serine/threonine protein kinase [Blastomyces gilchristii SLH14081]